MSTPPSGDRWEQHLRQAAAHFSYPATPDIAGSFQQRRARSDRHRHMQRRTRRLVLATCAIGVLALLAVPEVRASVWAFLRIGTIEFLATTPTPQQSLAPGSPPAPSITSAPPPVLRNLVGETTIADAQARLPFPIKLPTVPADLGPPDRVYVQDLGGPACVLVWLDPQQPDQIRLSLHQLSSEAFGRKMVDPRQLQTTSVNDRPAVWVRGPHLLQFQRGTRREYEPTQLVVGNVLIWEADSTTYRLESTLDLRDTVAIAESLRDE